MNATTDRLDNIVKGAGHWAPGTTVREIEGHFNPANEPKGVPPICRSFLTAAEAGKSLTYLRISWRRRRARCGLLDQGQDQGCNHRSPPRFFGDRYYYWLFPGDPRHQRDCRARLGEA